MAFADLPQQEAHGVGADLFDGEAGDAHPGGGQAEKRVFVHAGKPPTAVVDVDAPVVEIAQGLGGEDMRGEEKAVGVGNRGENAVERIADVLPVAGIGDLSVEAGIGVQSRFRQRAEVAPVPQFHRREVGEGRDDGDFAESPGGKMTDQRMAARLVVDHHAAGVRFREAAVEQHDRAAALRKAADAILEEQEKSRLLERYFASYEKYTEFLDNTNYTGVDRKLILDFLKLGAMEECDPFVEEYFAAIGENNYQSLLLRQYLTMDIFYCIQEFLKGLGEGNVTISPEVTDIKRIPKVIVSVDTTKMYLKEQFQAAIEARNSVSNDRYGSVIQSAKEYIEKNFSNCRHR